jgi:hypothetical protein
MRARPDRLAAGPLTTKANRRRHVPVPLIGLIALVLTVALVVTVDRLLAEPESPSEGAGAPATATVSAGPTADATPPLPTPPAEGDVDDSGKPSKQAARTAAAFVDAWLITDTTKRLARLKKVTVKPLYEGLVYTDPAQIPSAHRVGAPHVEGSGPYQVLYRVALSDESEVYVSTIYDGSVWLVESIEPVVG